MSKRIPGLACFVLRAASKIPVTAAEFEVIGTVERQPLVAATLRRIEAMQ